MRVIFRQNCVNYIHYFFFNYTQTNANALTIVKLGVVDFEQ